MRKSIARRSQSAKGATTAEVLVIAGVMVLVIITILGVFGDRLGTATGTIGRCISNAVRGQFGACGGGSSAAASGTSPAAAGGAGLTHRATGLPMAAMIARAGQPGAAASTSSATSGVAGAVSTPLSGAGAADDGSRLTVTTTPPLGAGVDSKQLMPTQMDHLPAASDLPLDVKKAKELNDLIGKQPKSKEDKDKILSAVKNRMERRAQELRDEIARTDSAGAKKKLAALETLIRRVGGRKYRYGGFWSTDKRFAYPSGDGIQLCDRFFDVPLAPQVGDEVGYMEVWLGERAAVLAHEEVHVDQAYWINWGERGETEAWTATEEWLEVFNKEQIESFNTRNKGYAEKSGGNYIPFDPEVQKETRTKLGKQPPTP